ncbi:MAG: ABC transporter substrate-binding protein [Janthinobacterium lividum]
MKTITKRIALTAMAVGASLSFTTGVVSAQTQEPIKIGLVLAKQGTWGEVGGMAAASAEIAVQQAGGKVLGRPIETIWYDEGSPQGAQQNMTKLIDQDKVVAVVGGSNSGTGLAMASVAKQAKIPFVITAAAARELTGSLCNRYTFRSELPTPVAARALSPTLLRRGKDWYYLVGNYAYGTDTHSAFAQQLKKAGGTEKGLDLVPVGTSDFSSYILKIKGVKPSVVIVGMGGTDQINFLKQWAEYGMKDGPLLATPITSDTSFWAAGPTATTGSYGMSWHYSDPTNAAADKEFVKLYIRKTGRPPAIEGWLGWVSMRMLIQSIANAGSTQPAAIVSSLETQVMDPKGSPYYFRKWDHQLIHQVLVTKAGPPTTSDKWNVITILDKEPKSLAQPDEYYGTPQEIGCTLEPL